ncbi:MAG TPA: L-2-hydroxyglutarate oxidase [Candidatus Deferrimicrobiaceae bacterium]|nr:L-2-hydroxyglutarate oxidase [Candidatus Deferrimicrobiaceae bacterium]
MVPEKAEVLIAGAGIIGLTLARSLVSAGWENVVLVEKEDAIGRHASGRNSGVLHAGIYYAPESLRARSCLNGNFRMRDYCREMGLPLRENGKVIVARDEGELPVLDELFRRATANGARVEMIDEAHLAEIEPNARTVGKALFSHDTACVDPAAVLDSLRRELTTAGKATIVTGCRFLGVKGSGTAVTSRGKISFRKFVNAAGAHCDRVAHLFGVGRRYRLIPFKGIYRKLRKGLSHTVRGNIYPVPDIRNPFLGVHFSSDVHGEVHLGPTAIPAFGRENYGILSGIDREGASIALSDVVLFLRNPKFRQVALTEPRKYSSRVFFRDAARLVKTLSPSDIEPSEKVGIRAQLVDWKTKELVMDFQVIADGDAIHILNPISPAFTSSMEIAETLVREHFTGSRADRKEFPT